MFKLTTGRKLRWLRKSVSAKKQKREEDKISGLPDEVLVSILSLLSIEEAARTAVLARRWRKVWTFIPTLNFDASQALLALKERRRILGELDNKMLAVERDKYVDWVNLVLDAYQGSSIDEFRVQFDLDGNHRRDIDEWVDFAFKKKVKRLVMELQKHVRCVRHKKVYSFPPLCDTFKRLHYCRYLIALELNCVNISGDIVEYFIASCPSLRQLSVERSDSFVDLKVSGESLCLEYLKIAYCDNLESIYISAANLLSFEYFGKTIKITFTNVPKLVELSFRGRYPEYIIRHFPELSNFAFQLVTLNLFVLHLEEKVKRRKFPLLAHLKNFELRVYGSEFESLLTFAPLIEAAPSLVRFALDFYWYGKTVEKRKRKKIPKCLHYCLKEVELAGFVGQTIDMELAIYLLENAIALEKIIVDPLYLYQNGYPLLDEKLKEIPAIMKQVMKLKSEFSLGDRLILRNF
ncbi:putative FBD-associated F-box protein At5g22720 isoform X2 [Tripterygium wilfordii]|uniref:putative FBD-associated F-box protein At5g22720 isoform X2 n=1 Tax=Tripterygium wilfordii TaxID=458696 RepID=UPI0018F7FB8A|nr:putative FBD-associated F-box protein At5g22720 isoform X2 [Tripterygium wilfordii]